jgi:hypothetical protein
MPAKATGTTSHRLSANQRLLQQGAPLIMKQVQQLPQQLGEQEQLHLHV